MFDAVKDDFSKRLFSPLKVIIPAAGVGLETNDRGGFFCSLCRSSRRYVALSLLAYLV